MVCIEKGHGKTSSIYLIACWVILNVFLLSADIFKINFSEKFFQGPNCLIMLDLLGGGGPDLGPNCLQRLSADGTSRKRVKGMYPFVDVKCTN